MTALSRSDHTPTTASFGFRDVPEQIRQQLVNEVFTRVADKYDLMNDLMSGGLHRFWKATFVSMINVPRNDRTFQFLDMAGGTGDITLRSFNEAGHKTTAVVCDINSQMLEICKQRVIKKGYSDRIKIIEGNAEDLPFPDRTFDAYAIAFGIRNVTNMDKALKEAKRVLKIGGHFLCLEFSRVTVPILDQIYDFHSFKIIPQIAKLTIGETDPYQYLVESIRKFPDQEKFSKKILDAGLSNIRVLNLTGGIAAIHSAWRL